ncbi:MAG TPA: adenylate/guanylate cyclase domain-containing protein [Mycobacteriales bacterium]|nr:adenylate/guanylate cyclase domain-containing protein [Mycobacteriales bacterium]
MSEDGEPTSPADIERELLGGERRHTLAELAELAGVEIEHAQELWRALGFADVEGETQAFTERDVWALRTVDQLGKQGWLDDAMQVSMARALGQSLARLADWQLAAIGSMADPDTAAEDALERAEHLVPVVEGLIGYVWRRHLAAAAARALSVDRDEFAARSMSVGFADLVGFTSLTRELDEVALGALVERFESTTSDIVASAGARMVKTIGDEVLFVADDVQTAAEVAMQLLEQVADLDNIPDLRIGLACGTVLSRLGDVYGEPVNLASRLTSIARPGSVLVDRDFASALDGDEKWRLRRVPPRPVRGYALLHPMRLRRADQPANGGT